MKHSRFPVPVVGACCLAFLLPPVAHAQDGHSMRQSFQTSGTLSWGDQKQSVQRVRVELDENGDARLKFDGQTRDWNWGWRDGDWRNWNGNQEIDGVWLRDARGIAVDLRTGLGGQIVVGSARIAFTDDFGHPCPQQLTLNGRIVRHPWETVGLSGRLDFAVWGDNGGEGDPGPVYDNHLDEFSTIKHGDGQFFDNGETSDITRADIRLGRDGTAVIVLTGDRDYTLGGRWRQTGSSRIELRFDSIASQTDRRLSDVTRPDADENWLGAGEIRVDGTHLVSLQLSGTRDNRDFEAHFEPQTQVWTGGGLVWNGGGDGGGWDGGGWNGTPGWNGGGGGNRPGGWHGNGGDGHWNGRGGGGHDADGNGNGHGNTDHGGGGGGPHPVPQPDLHGAWRGWTGEGVPGAKGTLPAPPPQAPIKEHQSGPFRAPSPDPSGPSRSKPSTPTPPSPPEHSRPAPPPEPERSHPTPPSTSEPSHPAPPTQPEHSHPAPPPEPERSHSTPPPQPEHPRPAPPPEPERSRPTPPQPEPSRPAPAPQQTKTDDKPKDKNNSGSPPPSDGGKEEPPRTRVGKPR